jgi:hypothetical protein
LKANISAVVVDLGQGRNLVGLLAAGPSGEDVDYPGRIVFLAFNLDGNDPNTPKRLPLLRGKRDLDIYHSSLYEVRKRFLPTFATLTDLTNPSTARVAPVGAFDEIFGTNFKLRSVTVEMTTDPITEVIESKIPWIGNYSLETTFERQLGGTSIGSSLTPGLNLKRSGL